MPEFNEQLARNALKRIKENPEKWDQSEWRCESGMCFAGFAAMEASAEWLDSFSNVVVTPDKRFVEVQVFASEVLGLDTVNWKRLFSGANTLKDLESLIDELSEGNDG